MEENKIVEKAITLPKKDAEEIARNVKRMIAGDITIVDDPKKLSKMKIKLSGFLYFIGELYNQAELEVNKEWLNIKTPDMTNEEATRIVQSRDVYLRFRKLKYQYKSIDRIITSIRDRLGVIQNEEIKSRDNY
jgi:ABC-type sulfate/molybdate transport systems ATPase subunit